MTDKVIEPAIVLGGSVSQTEIGQARHGPTHVKKSIRGDLNILRSAYEKWQRLKQRVKGDLQTGARAAGRGASRPTKKFNIAHHPGLAGLRGTMQRYSNNIDVGLRNRQLLMHGHDPMRRQAILAAGQLPHYRDKLEHLKLFDEMADRMFSQEFKVYRNLRGLSANVFRNVNRNLEDDMLVAQENKLLSVNARIRKDKSCGLVRNRENRRLIRQIVTSALLHHGYATAKTLKQELTKACELAESFGKNGELSRHVQARMRQVMAGINVGALAADAMLSDVELRNLAALANEDPLELLAVSSKEVSGRDNRKTVKKAVIQVAAKGGLNAARKFRKLLKGKPTREQAELATNTINASRDAKPKEPHYMYLPFNASAGGIDWKLDEGLGKYREKPHFTIIDRGEDLPKKPLGNIDPHHVLLIHGHGDYGYDGVSAVASRDALNSMSNEARREAILDADRLAERLEQDGLAKNHKVIRLLTCYSGGDTLRYQEDDHGKSLQPNHYDEAFARRLAVALKRRGYRNIVVGGYPGTVHPGSFGEHKAITASDGAGSKLIEASGLCRYFNGDGKVVPNPRNPEKASMKPDDTERTVADRIADNNADRSKPEFGFPVREKPKTKPQEPTEEDLIKQLDLSKPAHRYIVNLTKEKFFKDTDGNAHETPLFANRFRDYVDVKHYSGEDVDVIKDIDRVRSTQLDDDDGKAVETFKNRLNELKDALDGIYADTYIKTLKREIGKALESDDPEELKTFRDGRALEDARVSVKRNVEDFFNGFYMNLLKNPPADHEIPPNRANLIEEEER